MQVFHGCIVTVVRECQIDVMKALVPTGWTDTCPVCLPFHKLSEGERSIRSLHGDCLSAAHAKITGFH